MQRMLLPGVQVVVLRCPAKGSLRARTPMHLVFKGVNRLSTYSAFCIAGLKLLPPGKLESKGRQILHSHHEVVVRTNLGSIKTLTAGRRLLLAHLLVCQDEEAELRHLMRGPRDKSHVLVCS